MTTYPNQKIVVIGKEKVSKNFLQVNNDNWEAASRNLKDSAFRLYMYLSKNADGFKLALSQKAVEEAIGVKKTAYHSAIKELKEQGYITEGSGNTLYFFTSPVRKTVDTEKPVRKTENTVRKTVDNLSENEQISSQNDREIDNTYKTDKNIYGEDSLPQAEENFTEVEQEQEEEEEILLTQIQKERVLEQLSLILEEPDAAIVEKEWNNSTSEKKKSLIQSLYRLNLL